jgi:phage terminase small subunit
VKSKKKPTKKPKTAKKKTGLTPGRNSIANLTEIEKLICDLVVEARLPKSVALKEAGYNPTNAGRFFRRPKIKAYVDAKIAMRVATNKHRRDLIIQELQNIAFSRLSDFVEFDNGALTIKASKNLSDDQKAALAEISESVNMASGNIKIKLHDKNKALEILAKTEGMLIDRHKLGGDEDNKAPIRFLLGPKNLKPPEKD